jgi:hypothetical protein
VAGALADCAGDDGARGGGLVPRVPLAAKVRDAVPVAGVDGTVAVPVASMDSDAVAVAGACGAAVASQVRSRCRQARGCCAAPCRSSAGIGRDRPSRIGLPRYLGAYSEYHSDA